MTPASWMPRIASSWLFRNRKICLLATVSHRLRPDASQNVTIKIQIGKHSAEMWMKSLTNRKDLKNRVRKSKRSRIRLVNERGAVTLHFHCFSFHWLIPFSKYIDTQWHNSPPSLLSVDLLSLVPPFFQFSLFSPFLRLRLFFLFFWIVRPSLPPSFLSSELFLVFLRTSSLWVFLLP